MPETLIIGAGLTGLSTAYHCRNEYRLLEKEPQAGGLCRSVRSGEFLFDYSGHLLHLRHPEIRELVAHLCSSGLSEIERNTWVFTHHSYVPYPFQAHLHALPERLRAECLKGIRQRPRRTPDSYTDFLSWSMDTFGSGITRYFMKPYNEKLWTVSCRRLTTDWVGPFVPRPTLREIQRSARRPLGKRFGYNATFYYPQTGGCQSIADGFARKVRVEYGKAASSVDYRRKEVLTSNGERIHYNRLISTQPLPELLGQMRHLPEDIKRSAAKLDWNSVFCCNLAAKSVRDMTGGKQWVYFPEKKYPFYRAGVYTNIMPSMAPAGYTTFYVELSGRPGQNLVTRHTLSEVRKGLQDAGLLAPGEKTETVQWLTMPYAYVIYDKNRTAALEIIRRFLKQWDIYSIGRYGGWEYSFMEKNIMDGISTAKALGL